MNQQGKQARLKGRINHNHVPLTLTALGSFPTISHPRNATPSTMRAIRSSGAMPSLGRGSSVIAVSQVRQRRRADQTSFPKAFSSFGNFTSQGGFYVLRPTRRS